MSPRSDRSKHRSFTAQDTTEILAEYDATEPAAPGPQLRRELVYSSHPSVSRKAPDSGDVAGLSPAAKPGWTSTEQLENAKHNARVERPERELARTKAWEIERRAYALLETFFESADTELGSKP